MVWWWVGDKVTVMEVLFCGHIICSSICGLSVVDGGDHRKEDHLVGVEEVVRRLSGRI